MSLLSIGLVQMKPFVSKFFYDVKCVVEVVLAALYKSTAGATFRKKVSFLFKWSIRLIIITVKGDTAFEVFKPLLPTFFDVYPHHLRAPPGRIQGRMLLGWSGCLTLCW